VIFPMGVEVREHDNGRGVVVVKTAPDQEAVEVYPSLERYHQLREEEDLAVAFIEAARTMRDWPEIPWDDETGVR
jgi:hypothetical protein